MVKGVAEEVHIPFTVGGGIRSIEDVRLILENGADKISINTAAVQNPALITDSARRFGSQCILVAIDAKRNDRGRWTVYLNGGRTPTDIDAVEWAARVEEHGAGEILLTSMDRDGTQVGYDLELNRRVSDSVSVPVIASGGAGTLAHFAEVLDQGRASAVLAASLFHFGTFTVPQVKDYLATHGVPVRR